MDFDWDCIVVGAGPVALAQVGIAVVREPVTRLRHTDGRLGAIELDGRAAVARDALFFHVGMRPRTELAAALGCERDADGFVTTDPTWRETTVPRVYAAGNCADPMHNVPMAIADGARAAVAVDARLVTEGQLQTSSRTIANTPTTTITPRSTVGDSSRP
jgi:thioredoxin reductase